MAWRPPDYDNYGQYGGYQPRQQWQMPRPRARARGYNYNSNSGFPGANYVPFGRGYAPGFQGATMTKEYGRGRFPYPVSQTLTVNSQSEAQTDPQSQAQQPASTSHVHASTYPSNSQDHSQPKHYKSNEKAIYKDLDALESVWTDNKYPDKRSKFEALFATLSSLLANRNNPWETAYSYITMAEDYETAKTMTLSFQILLQFEKWERGPNNVLAGHEDEFLSQDFRVQVFYAMSGKHMAYFNSAASAFHLCHQGNEYFIPLTKALLLRDKLPEAAQVVSRLCLQSHFPRDEILVPLLLTDRVNLIESYIKEDKHQQMLILNLLDYLCDRTTDILSFAQSSGLKDIKAEKLSKKVLSKFAMRLIKMFGIPPEMCPNISENRAMSTVRFLIYKRYIEKSMTAGCWEDMVESTIGNNVSLQQQFILELMVFNDVGEAVKWVDKYRLPDRLLDPSVVEAKNNYVRENEDQMVQQRQQTLQTPSSSVSGGDLDGNGQTTTDIKQKVVEDWDKELSAPVQRSSGTSPAVPPGGLSSMYYSIPLSEADILLVDSRDKLMAALERLTRPSTAIGIDCEWKPIGPSQQVALLQLAVMDRVFLVDFITLDGLVSPQDWRHFAQSLFCDDKIIKIGYGLDTDLRMLSRSHPTMKDPLLKMVRVVELAKLAKTVEDMTLAQKDSTTGNGKDGHKSVKGKKEGIKLNNQDTADASNANEAASDDSSSVDMARTSSAPPSVGFPFKNEERGLSLLVKNIIGKPLCKDEQMSNWERRPLRRSQILYAAMDAYVLVELHSRLVSQAQTLGVTDRSLLEPSVVFRTTTKMERKKNRMTTGKKNPAAMPNKTNFTHATTTGCRPHEFRVVCDSMLQGLGNQLRSCGVDAHILSTGQLHDDAVQVALRENRIILTTGLPYEHVRSRVGEGMCYCVSNTSKSKDQCVDVLRHFKVQVNVDDIFSRCAVCNGAEFAHIPSVDMEQLYVIQLQQQQQQHLHQHHPHYHQGSSRPSPTRTTTPSYPASSSSSSSYSHHHPHPHQQQHYHHNIGMGMGSIDPRLQQMFLSKYGVDLVSLTFMHNAVRLQVETVSSLEAFQTIGLFYVCVGCGKVYWKGSHFDRIQEQFKPVLTISAQESAPPSTQSPLLLPRQEVQTLSSVVDVVVGKDGDDAGADEKGVEKEGGCDDNGNANGGGSANVDDGCFYGDYDEEEDHAFLQGDLENVNLQDLGFSGVWKMN